MCSLHSNYLEERHRMTTGKVINIQIPVHGFNLRIDEQLNKQNKPLSLAKAIMQVNGQELSPKSKASDIDTFLLEYSYKYTEKDT